MITTKTVEHILNEIIDPCSTVAGVSAGLVDMGLVRHISIDGEPDSIKIKVTLSVTHGMCLMAGVFLHESEIRLRELSGVEEVHVDLDAKHIWTPDDMTPGYRKALAEHRENNDVRVIRMPDAVPLNEAV